MQHSSAFFQAFEGSTEDRADAITDAIRDLVQNDNPVVAAAYVSTALNQLFNEIRAEELQREVRLTAVAQIAEDARY